jgi:glycosyltransferase involved in cell wall biosynthesis
MVSILLAVYNGEKYLRRSIESVLNQTYKDFELLIGFNGTIDNSKEIVKEFDDERIRIFDYGLDAGKSKTLNKLLKEAKGEWLAIQDDDDVWLPKKLEIQIELANTGLYDVIGSRIFYCDELEKITGQPNLSLEHEEILRLSMSGVNQVANTSAIFKKEIAEEVNGWDESIVGIEDYDFWLKLMKKSCKFINDKKQLVLHRIHNKSNFNTKKYDINFLLKKHDLCKYKIGIVIFHKNAKKIYNDRWLLKFFDSIVSQTYKDYFIYELNYGDDNYSFLGDYHFENGKFYKIEMDNHAQAMNYIIEEAFKDGCDFVFNTNVDDYYQENRIERQFEKLKEGYDIVSSNFSHIKENNYEDESVKDFLMTKKGEIIENLRVGHNVIAHPCVAYSKNFWDNNKYNEEDIPMEDLKLWQDSIEKGFKFYICEDILLYYRIHENQVTKLIKN